MKRIVLYLFVSMLCLQITTAQTIVEEEPCAPPEVLQPGFHEFHFDDWDWEYKGNRSSYTSEDYSIADCIRDTYVSPSLEYNGCDSLPYLMLPPEDTTGGELFPLVLDLHGQGGIGSSPTDLTGMNRRLASDTMRAMYPCYALSARLPERTSENEAVTFCHPIYKPNCDGAYPMKTTMIDIYIEMIEDVMAKYPIDPDRIYVAGHSHGGHGTRLLMTERPDLFAAGAPAASSPILFMGHPEIIGDNLPIWQFGGIDDATVGQHGLESSYDSLLFYGALDNIFWYRDDAGHAADHDNIRELVDWFFKQNKQDYRDRSVADIALTGATDGFAPIPVSFDGSASAPQGSATIVSYEWQIANSLQGLDTTSITFSGASDSYTFTEPGTHFIRLIVTDSEGRRRAKVERVTIYNPNPEASFVFNRNYEKVNKAINFNASASVPVHNESITSYAWDFGDGNTASGESTSHAYSAVGSYTCELIVTSSGGAKDTLSYPVEVTASFPGYQIFTFSGFDVDPEQTWRGASGVFTLQYLEGSKAYPSEPMTADVTGDYTASASSVNSGWNENAAYEAFDGDDETMWKPLPHRFPSTLTLDIGSGNNIMPTGMYLYQNNEYGVRFRDYTILGSVDGLMWDTIYEHKEDMGGTEPDISFPDFPYIEITNPLSGDTAGQGSVVQLQSELYNIDSPDEVRYYVDDSYVGNSAAGPDFVFEWTASLTVGTHMITARAVCNGTTDTVDSKSIEFVIDDPGVLTSIELTPAGIVLTAGGTQQYAAVAKDQYGNLINPQPSFSWTVSTGAGSISTEGLYTAGSLYGTFDIEATATHGVETVTGTEEVLVPNPDDLCEDYFPGTTLHSNWDTLDLDNYSGSSIEVNSGVLTMEGRGEKIWGDISEFIGIKRNDLTGDFDVSVKVLSQTDSDDNARAGIIVADNFDDLSEGGFAEVYTRPSGQYRFQYDQDGSVGEINKTSGSVEIGLFPVWLRLKKENTTFTAYYKTDATADWTQLGDPISPQATGANSQVAVFMNSNTTSVTGTAEFAEFKVANCVSGPSISITAPADGAAYNENDNITLQSSIVNMTETVDKVIYFANGSLLGESTTADTYDYEWNSVASGNYDLTAMAVYNSTADTIISAPVAITVLAPPVFSSISITPEDAVLLEEETETYTAVAKDQFGDPVDPQPTFNWTSTGGSIDASGVFTAGTTAGDYFVFAEADVDGVIIKDSVSVEVQEQVFAITITPASTSVLTEGTVQFTAEAADQFGTAADPQPTFTWTVSGGETISTDGLFTASTTTGIFNVYAEATVEGDLIEDSATVEVSDVLPSCLVTFEESLDAGWDTLLNCEDASGSVYIDESTDKLVLDASSGSCNTFFDRDFFNGIVSSPVSGDFEVSAKVTVNTAAGYEPGSRGGIIIGRNLSSGAGVASVAIRPQSSEYRMYYDSDGNALMDDWDNPGSGLHSNTSWLKITRQGDIIATYYKNDGDAGWTEIASHDVGFGSDDMDIVLAAGDLELHIDSVYMSVCPLTTSSTKQDQTITFDSIPDKLTTDAPFTVTATASSSLDVSLAILSGPATISGNEITLTGGTGVVEVEATQEGNENYEAADPVGRSFTVSLATNVSEAAGSKGGVTLYPNPATDKVSVKVDGADITKIILYSVDGVSLLAHGQGSVVSVDVSGLNAGVYILKVFRKDNHMFVRRLIVE